MATLRAWRRRQLEERLSTGRRDDEFVFARLDGRPVHPDYFSQCWERLVAANPFPQIRLHDLGHTHASILLEDGVPVKVVSERLGHYSLAFTMTVHKHVLPGMQADAAAAFGAGCVRQLISRSTPRICPVSTCSFQSCALTR